MGHPTPIQRAGVSNADNAIVLTVGPEDQIRECNEHFIRVTAGTIDVEVSIDKGASYSDSGVFPIAVLLLNATDPNLFVIDVAADKIALLLGHFDGIRLRQKGLAASAAHISSNPR